MTGRSPPSTLQEWVGSPSGPSPPSSALYKSSKTNTQRPKTMYAGQTRRLNQPQQSQSPPDKDVQWTGFAKIACRGPPPLRTCRSPGAPQPPVQSKSFRGTRLLPGFTERTVVSEEVRDLLNDVPKTDLLDGVQEEMDAEAESVFASPKIKRYDPNQWNVNDQQEADAHEEFNPQSRYFSMVPDPDQQNPNMNVRVSLEKPDPSDTGPGGSEGHEDGFGSSSDADLSRLSADAMSLSDAESHMPRLGASFVFAREWRAKSILSLKSFAPSSTSPAIAVVGPGGGGAGLNKSGQVAASERSEEPAVDQPERSAQAARSKFISVAFKAAALAAEMGSSCTAAKISRQLTGAPGEGKDRPVSHAVKKLTNLQKFFIFFQL
uniref:Uncharacterized protein n=1 Tax=Chromera velia CCMP2878 TaxID=1169474 RepID=A0A0G4I025_9ALVE|eukprot:Cvel_1594.t1-p1 / transcript=Cvel_1594.t1 / gene=Cvel_1594 / organism=Chromera_velia_CCMP2878 / gene_product=hypothetical protein / transcript_product=hypothetical protein / location=Cvel_scaffold57:46295-47422(-) / protein_length=376 / sequence_SO=supercontig / SO=protein_coding / is_pseudo=false